MVHPEATLKGLKKPDLIKLVLQLKSEMNSNIKELTSEIRDPVTQMKKVEADVAIVQNVNLKLVNQLIEAERQCWANAHYSRRECLEVVEYLPLYPMIYWKLMFPKFLVNPEYMLRGKTFRHVIV